MDNDMYVMPGQDLQKEIPTLDMLHGNKTVSVVQRHSSFDTDKKFGTTESELQEREAVRRQLFT